MSASKDVLSGSPQKTQWELGYEAGRRRESYPKDASSDFKAGWVKGDSAADEAENGYQMWGQQDD